MALITHCSYCIPARDGRSLRLESRVARVRHACAIWIDVAWYRRRARYRPTIPRRIKRIVAYWSALCRFVQPYNVGFNAVSSARRSRSINSTELCAIAVVAVAEADPYRRRHHRRRHSRCATRRATSAARFFGNELTVARSRLSLPQIPPLLRGESHLHRAIYGCVFSILLPFAPSRPTDSVSIPRRRNLLLENSTFLLGLVRRVMYLVPLCSLLSTFDRYYAK